MKNLFVSIINFNGKNDTVECLNSIEKSNFENIKTTVIVVDNGSDKKLNLNEKDFNNFSLKIIKSEKNLGFSGGHNSAIKIALENGADYVLISNNDVIFDKNLIKTLVTQIQKEQNIGIVCPKIYFSSGFEFHKDKYENKDLGKVFWYAGGKMDWNNIVGKHRGVDEVDSGQYNKVEETEFATGCCMLIKKEVFENIGYFNEKYFLYYEDSDFSQRVRGGKYKIIYVPNAVLWHKNAGSTGGSGSNLQDYYITRNRLLFGVKYAPLKSKSALIRESLTLMIRGRKWQKKGVIDFYLSRFGKGNYQNE